MSYTINCMFKDHRFDDIDVKAAMIKKLDIDIPAYRILRACNPKMALATGIKGA